MTSAARAEQVRETRRKVVAAARDLFLRRGYTGATVEAIAHRAAVSPQTVYNVIGGKAAVLKAVYDVTLAGDDEPVPKASSTWRASFSAVFTVVPLARGDGSVESRSTGSPRAGNDLGKAGRIVP